MIFFPRRPRGGEPRRGETAFPDGRGRAPTGEHQGFFGIIKSREFDKDSERGSRQQGGEGQPFRIPSSPGGCSGRITWSWGRPFGGGPCETQRSSCPATTRPKGSTWGRSASSLGPRA